MEGSRVSSARRRNSVPSCYKPAASSIFERTFERTLGTLGGGSEWALSVTDRTEAPVSTDVSKLRDARQKRTRPDHQGFDKHGGAPLPEGTYNSLCPRQLLCGQDPVTCEESRVLRFAFGHQADLATRNARAANKGDEDTDHLAEGLYFGYPALEDLGYESVSLERASRHASSEESHREHFIQTLIALNLTIVIKPGSGELNYVASFRKDSIIGSKNEVKILIAKLQKLDQSNVARLLVVCEEEMLLHFVYEGHLGLGAIGWRVQNNQEFEVTDGAKLCQQLGAALAAAHKLNLYLIDWSFCKVMSANFEHVFPIRLFGIGLAGIMYGIDPLSAKPDPAWIRRGAFYYMSPELARIRIDPEIKNAYQKLEASLRAPTDVWATGVLLWEAMAGHAPFGGATEEDVLQRIVDTNPAVTAEVPSLDSAGVELMERTLDKRPKNRPKAQGLINDKWVATHVRSTAKMEHLHAVVMRLCDFAKLRPAMRVLGKILMECVRPEQMQSLEESFNALDMRGDGELEVDELVYFLGGQTQEAKDLVSVLDTNGTAGISLHEFALANLFDEAILTERMLQRAFDIMDADGTGEISPIEFYTILRARDETLNPDLVADLLADINMDWDEDITFEEFRTFFPQVPSRAKHIEARINNASLQYSIMAEVFTAFRQDCREWVRTIVHEKEKLAQQQQKIAEESAEGAWAEKIVSSAKKLQIIIRQLPEPQIGIAIARERSALASRRAAMVTSEIYGDKNLKASPEEEGKKKKSAHSEYAAVSLDVCFRHSSNAWRRNCGLMVSESKRLLDVDRKGRHMEAVNVIRQLEDFAEGLSQQVAQFLEEQDFMIEAASVEAAIPAIPFSRRSIVPVVQDEAHEKDALEQEVEEFVKERTRRKEAATKMKEEQQALVEQRLSNATEAQRRGAHYLQKREEKQIAKRRGKKNQEASVAASGNNPSHTGYGLDALVRMATSFTHSLSQAQHTEQG